MKIFFLSLILLLNSKLISSQPYDAVKCSYEDGVRLRRDCSNGIANASVDNAGNVPDSCCQVYIYDRDCDEYGCSGESEEYCLQIKKDRAADYIDYIYNRTTIEPNTIRIACNGTKVIGWVISLSSSFIRSIRLCLLMLLFLF